MTARPEDDGPAQASVHVDIQIRTLTGGLVLAFVALLTAAVISLIVLRLSGRSGAPSH